MAASYTLSVGSKIQACASLRSVFEPISVRPLRWALSSMPLTFSKGLATPWSHHSGRDARIFIKNLTGRKMLVTVALDGSAFRLKQLLETTENVPVDDIRLVYSAKQLADDKPLEFYNIQAGCTIHMMLGLGRRIQPLCATFAPCINPFVASDGRPVPDLPRLGWSYKQTCGDLLPLRKHTAGRDGRTSLSIGNAVEVVCRDGTGRALWCRTIVREVHGSRVLVDLGEEDIHEAIRQRKAEEDHRALVALRATEAKAARGADIYAMSVRGLSDAALDQLLADAQAAQAVLARELRSRLDAERDKHLCVVCLTRPKEYAPSACGHFALCEACMPRVDSCPICRIPTDPEDWDRVYA